MMFLEDLYLNFPLQYYSYATNKFLEVSPTSSAKCKTFASRNITFLHVGGIVFVKMKLVAKIECHKINNE